MRTALLLVLASSLWAQAPIGNNRIRLGNANSSHYNRTGINTGAGMWDFSMASAGSIAALSGDAGALTIASGTTPSGQGLAFNGSTDLVYRGLDTVEVQPTATFSVTTIGKVTVQQNLTFVSKWDDTTGYGSAAMYCGEGAGTKRCACAISQSDTTSKHATDPNDSYTVGAYFVMTCVADGSFIRTYINGVQVAALSYDGSIYDGPSYLVFGSLNNATWFLNGVINFVEYRKIAMTAAEVKQSYRGLRAAYCTKFGGAYCTDLPQ